MTTLQAWLRTDGRKGIRNIVAVCYLVECAHHVAREVTYPFREDGAHLIGFPGCFPNAYSHKMLERLCTHPNVGAVLLVSLGCEAFDKGRLLATIRASGRPSGPPPYRHIPGRTASKAKSGPRKQPLELAKDRIAPG